MQESLKNQEKKGEKVPKGLTLWLLAWVGWLRAIGTWGHGRLTHESFLARTTFQAYGQVHSHKRNYCTTGWAILVRILLICVQKHARSCLVWVQISRSCFVCLNAPKKFTHVQAPCLAHIHSHTCVSNGYACPYEVFGFSFQQNSQTEPLIGHGAQ